MKLVWKLAIPQTCIVVCFGLISFLVINSSFTNMREHYVKDVIENRFQFIMAQIEVSAQRSVDETSMFVRLPAVMQAYEIALSGDSDDPYSPQSQEARDLLRQALAPMMNGRDEVTGRKLQLHFHLPNGLSLVRVWRDKNTRVNGEWVDISDDLRSYRPTVMDVNRDGEIAKGLEPGSGGFAIRGVIPVIAADGRQIGSGEALQEFDPILEAANEEGKVFVSLYANNELLDFSVELQDPEKYPPKGEFVQVFGTHDNPVESLISAEILSSGKNGILFEDHGSTTLATFPLADYRGNQVGVLVFAMNTGAMTALANTAALILALMLAGMTTAPTLALLLQLRRLVTRPLNKIKAKIQDIAENRVDLSERIFNRQKDEIGELARWFNTLSAKLNAILQERQAMLSKIRSESEKFEEAAHWYGSILDSIPFLIFVQDTDMKWIFINKVAENVLGKRREDVIGLPCRYWGISNCNTDKCAIACAKRGVKQTRFLYKGASYQANVEILRNLHGEITGFIELIQDITQLEQLAQKEAEAKSANQAKSAFLAHMSHEIRTPMNAIIGMTELALREEMSKAAYEHVLTIKHAGANLLSIINDILDFSKIESGKLEIVPVNYMFSSLINDVISIIRMRVLDSQVRFVVNIDCGLPDELFGDETRIRQILLNVLSNAVKYTQKGVVYLTIEGELAEENTVKLKIAVMDTGKGIKEEDMGKLFGDFVQVDLVRNRGIEGTGLGLAITGRLIQAMDGEIGVSSEYGTGSTFTILLPQKYTSGKKLASVKNAEEKSVLVFERRNIYIVSIRRTLENLGVSCTFVSSDAEFSVKLLAKKYPFVFISSTLYEQNRDIVSDLGSDTKIVLLTDFGEAGVDKNLSTLAMPVYSLSVANILNNVADSFNYRTHEEQGTRFVAPEARILIVDDIKTNLKIAEGLLQPYKVQVDLCTSGMAAINAAESTVYDLVFMDHMMPDIDGVEAARRIRALESNTSYYKDLPIVALTANAISGAEDMLIKNEFNDYLTKPIDMVKLNMVLEKWIPREKKKPSGDKNRTEAVSLGQGEIEGININEGIAMTGGSMDTYLQTLAIFYADGLEKMEEIRTSLKEINLPLYTTYVHALISASASIGAKEVSEAAKALETAAKRQDFAYIRAHNNQFLEDLKKLLEGIDQKLSISR
ncbi:MAG: ATP-binding protein [Peptococcaceae bacterium]|nr:ATP-binding protein [Peptococcaceae bacterium]